MYVVEPKGRYDRLGNRWVSKAPFLILMQDKTQPINVGVNNIRALVASVALRQCGCWMMGSARIAGRRVGISGPYGADGLTCNVDPKVFAQGVPLPEALYHAWNKGGGHNSAGSEAPKMREWAREFLTCLKCERGLRLCKKTPRLAARDAEKFFYFLRCPSCRKTVACPRETKLEVKTHG